MDVYFCFSWTQTISFEHFNLIFRPLVKKVMWSEWSLIPLIFKIVEQLVNLLESWESMMQCPTLLSVMHMTMCYILGIYSVLCLFYFCFVSRQGTIGQFHYIFSTEVSVYIQITWPCEGNSEESCINQLVYNYVISFNYV